MTHEDEMALAMVAHDLKSSGATSSTACELCGDDSGESWRVICSCSGIYCEWCIVAHRKECDDYHRDIQGDIEYDLWEEKKL